MGLLRRISDERERQIVAHAEPYLDDGEQVIVWARVRRPAGKPQGFVYLTELRFVVHWPGKSDGHGAIPWAELDSWGVNGDAKGGPILAVETPGASHMIQMRAETEGMTTNILTFLRRFAELAPKPRRALSTTETGSGEALGFRPDPDVVIGAEKRSLAGQTRRILVTVLGALLVIAGVTIIPVPGPWSFPVILGGLAILSSEYDWAKDALDWVKKKYGQAKRKFKARGDQAR